MKCADALEPMARRLDSLLLPFREKVRCGISFSQRLGACAWL